jgi:hypothetical protein
MSIKAIKEQLDKSKKELDAKKQKHQEIQKKLSHKVAALVIDSGLLDLPISEEELLSELKECAERIKNKSSKTSSSDNNQSAKSALANNA